MEKGWSFKHVFWGNSISTCKRITLGLTPNMKINLKWIKHLNVRAKTIKLLAEHTGEKAHDSGFSSDFWI